MMVNNLMHIANGLILSAFIGYFLLVIFNSNKKVTNSSGFNITKEVLDEYDSINIIENKNYFTIYNVKRKVIKIASKCYYGNSLSDLSIPLIEAGISMTDDNKNKTINLFRMIIPNLKLLYFLPIIAVFLNFNTHSSIDAKMMIAILVILSFVSYAIISIKTEGYNLLTRRLAKVDEITNKNRKKILAFINKVYVFDKIIFVGELIMIIRFVAILLQFN